MTDDMGDPRTDPPAYDQPADIPGTGEDQHARAIGLDAAEVAQIEALIAETLGIERATIAGRGDRFYYAFAEIGGRPAFIKLARESEHNNQLIREYVGQCIAARLQIPCVKPLSEYVDTADGRGVLCIERLDLNAGELFPSPEILAAADPGYGRVAARTLSFSGQYAIPGEIDISLLKHGDGADWRNQSADTFWKVWEEGREQVLAAAYDDLRDQIIPRAQLKSWLTEVRNSIGPLIAAADKDEAEYLVHNNTGLPTVSRYFVHNDTSPNNVFFQTAGGGTEGMLLDFEHAGATHNRILARLTDWGNYFARCWSNPAMQKEFISGLMETAPLEDIDERYETVRALILFGSMYLAKYGMDKDHPEHQMSVMLLANLPGNLAHLQTIYEQVKSGLPPAQ